MEQFEEHPEEYPSCHCENCGWNGTLYYTPVIENTRENIPMDGSPSNRTVIDYYGCPKCWAKVVITDKLYVNAEVFSES